MKYALEGVDKLVVRIDEHSWSVEALWDGGSAMVAEHMDDRAYVNLMECRCDKCGDVCKGLFSVIMVIG